MNVSIPTRALINSWVGFARGESMDTNISKTDCLLMEYASEELGKKNGESVMAKFFSSQGKHDIVSFYMFVRPEINRSNVDRMTAEALYFELCDSLMLADWPRPSPKFVSSELLACAEKYWPVVEEAISQCSKYNGNNWKYFRVVAEQLASTHAAQDYAEQKELEGMRLPDNYFDAMKTEIPEGLVVFERKEFRIAIENKKEDKLIGEIDASEKN